MILAMSSDKQIPEMLAELAPVIDAFHLTQYRSNPRSFDPDMGATILRQLGKSEVSIYSGPGEAWAAARKSLGWMMASSWPVRCFLAGELRPVMVRIVEQMVVQLSEC